MQVKFPWLLYWIFQIVCLHESKHRNHGKIKYQPYFTLKQFRDFVLKKENFIYIKNQINNDQILNNFLKNTEFINENKETSQFDYNMFAGDAIIFDEGGIHKGSRTMLTDRMVLRYLYSIQKN